MAKRSRQPRPGRSCAFCGGGPVTKEDASPKWIQRHLGQRSTISVVGSPGNPPERVFPSLSFTATVKKVCSSCNSGWMADLENEASVLLKRMLDEKLSIALSGDSLELLARWAMKTALTLALTQPMNPIPDTVYKEFFATRTPPTGTVIFLARRAIERNPSGGHLIETELLDPNSNGRLGHLWIETFFLQNLVFQVVGYTLNVKAGPNVHFPQKFAPFIQGIWPARETVYWPPPTATLTERQTLEFAFALAKIRRKTMFDRDG